MRLHYSLAPFGQAVHNVPRCGQDERCSIADQLILTPNAIEIDDWQASLLHPCAADRVYPPLILVDFVGAAIGADQDISALFLQMCADEGEPDVFADRKAQLCAAEFKARKSVG